MAIQLINIGQIANDGTGDDLREAMIKINNNFEELDLRDDEQTTASNLGIGEGLFSNKLNYDLQFKSLVEGSNITLTSTETGITIDALGGLQQLIVSSDTGSLILADGDTINIVGGEGIATEVVGNVLTINNTKSEIVTDTTPELGGALDARGFAITNVGAIDATSVTAGSMSAGNIDSLVYNIDIRNLSAEVESIQGGFDFGGVADTVENILDWIISATDVDFGTFSNPDGRTIDGGSLV